MEGVSCLVEILYWFQHSQSRKVRIETGWTSEAPMGCEPVHLRAVVSCCIVREVVREFDEIVEMNFEIMEAWQTRDLVVEKLFEVVDMGATQANSLESRKSDQWSELDRSLIALHLLWVHIVDHQTHEARKIFGDVREQPMFE